jgi:hypothetical protein
MKIYFFILVNPMLQARGMKYTGSEQDNLKLGNECTSGDSGDKDAAQREKNSIVPAKMNATTYLAMRSWRKTPLY